MKKIEIILSDEQREKLTKLQKRLVRLLKQYCSANAHVQKLTDSQTKLIEEIADLEVDYETLDADQLTSLATKKTSLNAITERLNNASSSVGVPQDTVQELQACARITGETISEIMREVCKDARNFCAQAVAPFYNNADNAHHEAGSLPFIRGFYHLNSLSLGSSSGSAYSEGQYALKIAETILKGESPYKFPQVKSILELAIFAN